MSNTEQQDGTQGARQTWIFQANPERYRIYESLRAEQTELWNLRQHARDVREGDRVLIWLSGSDAGIYAVGTVLASPMIMPDTLVGQGYWVNAREGQRPIARVSIRYDQVLLKRPLAKAFLQAVPDLWEMRIFTAPRGTNFPVSEAEWQAIRSFLDVE